MAWSDPVRPSEEIIIIYKDILDRQKVWREYLASSLLPKSGAWRGNIKLSLPDNFFDDKKYPVYDYANLDNLIKKIGDGRIDGLTNDNDYIKTNLYRWNETHFRLGKYGEKLIGRTKSRQEIQDSSSIV